MQFTGNSLSLTRNLYTQTGSCGFNMTCSVDNTTGQYSFGFSGSAGAIAFQLQSGWLSYQGTKLHSYRSNEPFVIEVQTSPSKLNLIKDNSALLYECARPTGYIDHFYFNRENATIGGEFDLSVSGNGIPTYTIQNVGYLVASGQAAVTGWFFNQSAFPVRVFDSTIQATQNYSFGKLVGNVAQSGQFTYSGDFSSLDLTQPILTTFNTNYGDESVLFYIVDTRTLNRFVQLTAPTDFSFNATGILSREMNWLNYSGGFVTTSFGTDLTLQLGYIGGNDIFTGAWMFETGLYPTEQVRTSFDTGLYSGNVSLPPNSSMFFTVYASGTAQTARLLISGADTINPINQSLSYP